MEKNVNSNTIININSFNCRGLRNKIKRNTIFSWLKTSHFGITMLQETHTISTDHKCWTNEWEGKIFFSDGDSNAKGVAILIPKEFISDFELIELKQDNNGRFLLLNCKLFKLELILVNVYCPTKDNQSAQTNFYNFIYENINNYSDKNVILGGDLNTYLTIDLDKNGGKQEKQSQFSEN